MPRLFSVYLDLLRAIAAFAVFVAHLTIQRFHSYSETIHDHVRFGPEAVMIFFVISGFVVAHAADRDGMTARRYAFDRATRIYSVFVPALVLTFAIDLLGASLRPAEYAGGWMKDVSAFEYGFYAITTSHEWLGMNRQIGTNGPLWSVSYETAYYALFGVIVFARGWLRAAALCLGLWVAGVNVLLLAPIWLFGVLIHRQSKSLPRATALHLLIAVGALVAYGFFQTVELRPMLNALARALSLRFLDGDPGRSGPFLWFTVVGALFALHLGAMLVLLNGFRGAAADRLATSGPARGIRWLAGGTFSLYVVHFPLIVFIEAVLPDAIPDPWRVGMIGGGALAAAYAFASVFERPLPRFRDRVRAAVAREESASPGVIAASTRRDRPED